MVVTMAGGRARQEAERYARAVGFACPECGSDDFSGGGDVPEDQWAMGCKNGGDHGAGCGWRVRPGAFWHQGYYFMGRSKGVPRRCRRGHAESWATRKLFGRTDARCCYDMEYPGRGGQRQYRPCGARWTRAKKQGFLNGKTGNGYGGTKLWIVNCLDLVEGFSVTEILERCAPGQITRGMAEGSLGRLSSARHPYVRRSEMLEPVMPRGLGYLWYRTEIGDRWLRFFWAQKQAQEAVSDE